MRPGDIGLEGGESQLMYPLLHRTDMYARRVAYHIVVPRTLDIQEASRWLRGLYEGAVGGETIGITLQSLERRHSRTVDLHYRPILPGGNHHAVAVHTAGLGKSELLSPHLRRHLLLHNMVAPRITSRHVDAFMTGKNCDRMVGLHTRSREITTAVLGHHLIGIARIQRHHIRGILHVTVQRAGMRSNGHLCVVCRCYYSKLLGEKIVLVNLNDIVLAQSGYR